MRFLVQLIDFKSSLPPDNTEVLFYPGDHTQSSSVMGVPRIVLKHFSLAYDKISDQLLWSVGTLLAYLNNY